MGKIKAAKNADRYDLYIKSVQDPDSEVKFVRRTFNKMFHKEPRTLREDFCGTGAVACSFVRTSPENRAVGVDLDPVPLAWGREHHLAPLGEAASRVKLMEGDVLHPPDEKFDIVCANNFSYFAFKTREKLSSYFRAVHKTLNDEGFLYLDIYGGPEAMIPQLEEWEYDDFTYVWDQDFYDPVTGDYRCYIHFKFPDGSKMKKAFKYDWCLWNLVEVKDLLYEVGYRE
ncbi:MAG: class I SAM-dependent methyltransferase, partial [Gemmatimonadetes bacterium]|nr:class I SAM-dependent methyltransferase [Gemmatimonadota bacterium]